MPMEAIGLARGSRSWAAALATMNESSSNWAVALPSSDKVRGARGLSLRYGKQNKKQQIATQTHVRLYRVRKRRVGRQ